MQVNFILEYNGDGATPAAIFADPANGIQWPLNVPPPTLRIMQSIAQLDDDVRRFIASLTHGDSGLENIHMTVHVRDSGPNAGEAPASDGS